MPTPVTLGTGIDTVTLSQGPSIKINSGSDIAWNDHVLTDSGGFDTLIVDENSTKTSYFTIDMTHDGIVTLTSASGSGSKYVSVVNFEQIKFWDVTMNLGTAGNDSMTGTSFAENLYGFDGNDTLDGGAGNDKMFGGAGDDTYVVSAVGDVVTELVGEGVDTIQTAITYSLADTDGAGANGGNVDHLTLTGAAAINGTGNALNNTITGNAASNILNGGLGNDILNGGLGIDTLLGGGGDDLYFVDDATEVITELAGEGKDFVRSTVTYTLGDNVENLTLLGTAAVNATGNIMKNVLIGNKADNILTGGRSKDFLTGGLGADTFDFNSVADSFAGVKHDIVKDFVHLTDKIDLLNVDANSVTAGNGTFTFLEGLGSAFTGVAGQLHFVALGANTLVEGDTNGDTVADFQIELFGTIALTAADFIL